MHRVRRLLLEDQDAWSRRLQPEHLPSAIQLLESREFEPVSVLGAGSRLLEFVERHLRREAADAR